MTTRIQPLPIVRARSIALSALLLLGGLFTYLEARAADPVTGRVKLDVVFVPTPEAVVQRMLEMADVQPDDYVVDLGSGDGRIVVAAARDRGVKKALGVDLDPERVADARKNAAAAGVDDRVTFEQGDLFEKDFSDANVLTMYLLPSINVRLRPVILETMAPGTRVVSHAFDMGDWEPDEQDTVDRREVFLWIVPAQVEGNWQLNGGGTTMDLSLNQNYQEISGHATVDGKEVPLTDASLKGAEIRFSIGDQRYVGKVDGDKITAVSGDGAASDWSASRS